MPTHFTLPGKVYLVGAGPGSAKLLTLRALEILRTADLVLHDDLVSDEVLAMIPPHISVHSVGKRCGMKRNSQEEISRRMITAARAGLAVVRLKGGDPLVFGRTQEEITALRGAKIDFEIVPGITAATAAAASAQIPLTERTGASKLILISNHCCAGKTPSHFDEALANDSTLVFYMPGKELHSLAIKLRQSGLSEDLPCLLVSQVSRPGQKIVRTTLSGLASLPLQPSPSLLMIGSTVNEALADQLFLPNKATAPAERWHVEDLSLDFPASSRAFTTKLIL